MSDLDRYLTDDLVDKVIDAIDGRRHEYRANTDTWVPYCICGWSAEEPYDMAAYDRHLAVEALKAAVPLTAAQALEDAADRLDLTGLERNSELSRWDYDDSSDFYEELVTEWLTAQARAAKLRGTDHE